MTGQSTLRRTQSEIQYMETKKAELDVTPPIDFWTVIEEEEQEGEDYDKSKYVTIKVPFDINKIDDDDANNYTARIKVFKNGTPEEFCNHRMEVQELANKLGYNVNRKDSQGQFLDAQGNVCTEEESNMQKWDKMTQLARSALRGNASRLFEKCIDDHADPTTDGADEKETLLDFAWNQIALSIFQHPKEAYKTQMRYLREGGLKFCGPYVEPRKFYERLDRVCEYMLYFPIIEQNGGQRYKYPTEVPDDERIEILDKARGKTIRKLMLAAGDNSRRYNMSSSYSKKLQDWHNNAELADALDQKEKNGGKPNKKKRKGDDQRPKGGDEGKPTKRRKKAPCAHCGRFHPGPDSKCWTLEANKKDRPDGYRKPSDSYKKRDGEGHFKSKKDFDIAVSRAVLKATKEI